MTNYEKYRSEIFIKLCEGHPIAFINNKIDICDGVRCHSCRFKSETKSCFAERKNWLNAEYKEPITLTEREHAFCVAVSSGYITRDKLRNGLMYFTIKPYRMGDVWGRCREGGDFINITHTLPHLKFPFIKWEDEPYSIEELLKMPVKESGEK